MESPNLCLITTIFIFYLISTLKSTVHSIKIQELDDLVRSYAPRESTRRHTGSLYEISLPSNLSDIKASIVTVRNSVFWRKGVNFNGVYIPKMVKTVPYCKRIAFVYENIGDYSSSVYFRLSKTYSFISPVIGFSVYDATNTSEFKKLNLSVKRENPILIKFDSLISHHQRTGIKCIDFRDNGVLNFTNTTRNYECATTNSHGHYALVIQNHKPESKPVLVRRNWWWFTLTGIGILVIVVVVIVGVVKLVRKKRLREMERKSEKSEMIGNIWIGRSRMPTANMVRTQASLEYLEDLTFSSNIS